MATAQIKSACNPSPRSGVSALGIIFFLMGAPHLYGFLQRRANQPKPLRVAPYAAAMLLAGAIAGAVELSIF